MLLIGVDSTYYDSFMQKKSHMTCEMPSFVWARTEPDAYTPAW